MSNREDSSFNKGHYKFKLDDQIQTLIQEYEEALKKYYTEGGPTDQELSAVILEQAERFAASVLKGTQDFSPAATVYEDFNLVEPELDEFLKEIHVDKVEMQTLLEAKGINTEALQNFLHQESADSQPENVSCRQW